PARLCRHPPKPATVFRAWRHHRSPVRSSWLGHMLALVSPGQGAQTPGMLAPWMALPRVASRLHWAAAVTGIDLVRLGTTGSAEEIRDTAVAQPLLVAFALAVAGELVDESPQLLAGHSVGEYAAAALSGALTPETALVLVRERGRLMAQA